MLSLDNFDTRINATIVQRGLAYFQEKAVETLEEESPGTWLAVVEGSEAYDVEIRLSGKNILGTSCDCPYDGGICKHVVAVLFALRGQTGKTRKAAVEPAKPGFEDLLSKLDLAELRDFVRHQKSVNRDFETQFMLFFAEKDPRVDVGKKYESMVRQIVRKNSGRGFMEYRQTFAFSKEIRQLLTVAEAALGKNNFREAFAIGKVLCTEIITVIQASDDSAGNIGGLLSSGIRILDAVAESPASSPELRDQLFEFLLNILPEKEWFDIGDFGYELLAVAEKLAARTAPDRYLGLLDTLLKIHVGKYSDYAQDYFKTEKISFLESIGRQEEAEKLVEQNMEIVEVRQEVVQKSIQRKDYKKAKQLIREGIGIAESKQHPGTVSQWEKVLLDIAYLENDLANIRHFTRKFAFDRGLNPRYYQMWKATFPPKTWSEVIGQHIYDIIEQEKAAPKKAGTNRNICFF